MAARFAQYCPVCGAVVFAAMGPGPDFVLLGVENESVTTHNCEEWRERRPPAPPFPRPAG